jgi:hypothetical protein
MKYMIIFTNNLWLMLKLILMSCVLYLPLSITLSVMNHYYTSFLITFDLYKYYWVPCTNVGLCILPCQIKRNGLPIILS